MGRGFFAARVPFFFIFAVFLFTERIVVPRVTLRLTDRAIQVELELLVDRLDHVRRELREALRSTRKMPDRLNADSGHARRLCLRLGRADARRCERGGARLRVTQRRPRVLSVPADGRKACKARGR